MGSIVSFLLPSPGSGGGDSVLHHPLLATVAGKHLRLRQPPLPSAVGAERHNGMQKQRAEVILRGGVWRRLRAGRVLREEVLEYEAGGGSAAEIGGKDGVVIVPNMFVWKIRV